MLCLQDKHSVYSDLDGVAALAINSSKRLYIVREDCGDAVT